MLKRVAIIVVSIIRSKTFINNFVYLFQTPVNKSKSGYAITFRFTKTQNRLRIPQTGLFIYFKTDTILTLKYVRLRQQADWSIYSPWMQNGKAHFPKVPAIYHLISESIQILVWNRITLLTVKSQFRAIYVPVAVLRILIKSPHKSDYLYQVSYLLFF